MAAIASETRPQAGFLKYDRTIGMAGMEGRGFYYPVDTAIASDGKLYVVSRSHEEQARGIRVTVCGLEGEYHGVFGSYGQGDGQFVWPTAIAIDSEDRVYVADEHLSRITIFDPSGAFLANWGVEGKGDGELRRPSSLAFDAANDLYVADHLNNRVQKFSRDGRFIAMFGEGGDGPGEFNLPWGLTVARSGAVYVADWRNDRIQEFSSDGRFVASFGESGDRDGQFRRPSSVAVDGNGYVYVADWGNHRVQVMDQEGGFVTKLRGRATLSKWAKEFLDTNVEEAAARSRSDLEPELEFATPHEESSHVEKLFWAPVSVKLDKGGRLYVTESHRHRIQVYQRAEK